MSSGVGGFGRGVGLWCGFVLLFSCTGEGDGLGVGEGESDATTLPSGVGDVSGAIGDVGDGTGEGGSFVRTFAPRSL